MARSKAGVKTKKVAGTTAVAVYTPDPDEVDLLDQFNEQQADSESYMSTLREGFDEKEAMLIQRNDDAITASTRNRVYDPILSTALLERTARVMAQRPSGKARAISKDDLGKSAFMNLLLDWQKNQMDEDDMSYLIRLRQLMMYSDVYGSMFALVPWRVDKKSGYTGPNLEITSIWDNLPQPGMGSVYKADWHIIRNVTSINWLLQRDPEMWKMANIKQLARDLKENKDRGDVPEDSDKRSLTERTMFPSKFGDVAYPRIELFTKYERGRWITKAGCRIDPKTNREYILRDLKGGDNDEVYPDNMLPIVAKHAFPLLGSPIGLGAFERGRTLQHGANAMINLYLTWVRQAVNPHLMINAGKVVMSSIKFGSTPQRWYMENPGKDIVPFQQGAEGMNAFQSTYGFFKSAIANTFGSTEVNQSAFTQGTLGRTPEAIKAQTMQQGTQDEWAQVMIEETEKQIMKRCIALNTHNLEKKTAVDVFGEELKDLMDMYPNEKDIEQFKSGKAGRVFLDKSKFEEEEKDEDGKKVKKPIRFNYEVETGSSIKPDLAQEQNDIVDVLKLTIENPQLQEMAAREGKRISVVELYKRAVKLKVRDVDKIVLDDIQDPNMQPEDPAMPPMPEQGMPVMPGQPPMPVPEQMPVPQEAPMPQEQPAPQMPRPQLGDPEIMAAYDQLIGSAPDVMGGMNGIPRM